jgi:hypothetical protein
MTAHVVAEGEVVVTWIPGRREPTAELGGRIDGIWAAARKMSPSLFDGSVLSVVRWTMSGSAVNVVGQFVPYRQFIARQRAPNLDLEVRPLGVSAFTMLGGDIVLGTRGEAVTEYPGGLELVPSGSIDTRAALPSGAVDWRRSILDELAEETGVRGPSSVRALGLIHDEDHDVYDLACLIELPRGTTIAARSGEYQSLSLVDSAQVLARRDQLIPTSGALLDLALGALSF